MPTAARIVFVTLIFLAGMSPVEASAQSTVSAKQAYDHAQQVREEAEPLWRKGDPRGIAMLEELLLYLASPNLYDLANGNVYLAARTANTYFDLVLAYSLVGDTSAALESLRQIVRDAGGSLYARWLDEDSATVSLRESPTYQRTLAQLRAQARRWNDSTFSTPYREIIDEHEMVAGLSLLWAEIKFNYPTFELTPGLNWDSLYVAYLPKVRHAANTYEYYSTLKEFCAHLRDGHTRVFVPPELGDRYARPALRTLRVEGKTLVWRIFSPTIERLGIAVGQEVEAIDGVPVDEYVRTGVAPYQSASTRQDLDVRSYSYALLSGPSDQPVALTLRRHDGTRLSASLPRSGYTDIREQPRYTDSILTDNIGYLRIDTFSGDSVAPFAREALNRLAGTSALIIDVRYNGGGNSWNGYRILSMLADQPFAISESRTRRHVAVERAYGIEPRWHLLRNRPWEPDGELHYAKPVVVLTSPMTYSAAEDFVVAFDAMERGMIIGEPTGGNTGQPLIFPLPGGGRAWVRTKHDSYPDGRQFVGSGVQPTVPVQPTVAGIRAGRDEVLEAAILHLRARR